MDMRQASTVAVAPMSTMIRQKWRKIIKEEPPTGAQTEGRADCPPEATPGGCEPPGEGGAGVKWAE